MFQIPFDDAHNIQVHNSGISLLVWHFHSVPSVGLYALFCGHFVNGINCASVNDAFLDSLDFV